MPTIRSYAGNLQIAKQNQRGTPATTGFHEFRRVDGRISVEKQIESVNYIDGNAWSAQDFDYVQQISGAGSLTIQATPEGAARLLAWSLAGTDTVTGASNPYTHTIDSPGTGLTYLTVIDAVGGTGLVDGRQYSDCVITEVEITSAFGDVVTVKLDLLAITINDGGNSLPASATTTDGEPLLHTQGSGNGYFKLAGLNSGATVPEVEQFVLTVNTGIELLYGDSVKAYIAHKKRGTVSWSCTAAVTDETIKVLNQHLYGSASPSLGATPSTSVFTGSFNPKLYQSASRELEISIPKNRVMVEAGSVDPNAAGDKATLSIAGMARKPDSGSLITVTAKTGDSAAY